MHAELSLYRTILPDKITKQLHFQFRSNCLHIGKRSTFALSRSQGERVPCTLLLSVFRQIHRHSFLCRMDIGYDSSFYHQHPEIGSRRHYMDCLKKNYDAILEKAVLMNPIPKKEKKQRGRPKKGKIRSFIDRLQKYKDEVCRFADNPLVPFTNNQAERDLRMVKMKSKVIGTFRSEQGAKDFLTLKSLTSTAVKSGITAFYALLSLFHGQLALGTE